MRRYENKLPPVVNAPHCLRNIVGLVFTYLSRLLRCARASASDVAAQARGGLGLSHLPSSFTCAEPYKQSPAIAQRPARCKHACERAEGAERAKRVQQAELCERA